MHQEDEAKVRQIVKEEIALAFAEIQVPAPSPRPTVEPKKLARAEPTVEPKKLARGKK